MTISCPYRAAIQKPDKLTFTDKLPVSWLPTAMYIKATKTLYRHNSGKNTPQYHIISDEEYLVLTSEGEKSHKKVSDKLVERYRAGIELSYHIVSYRIISYHIISHGYRCVAGSSSAAQEPCPGH